MTKNYYILLLLLTGIFVCKNAACQVDPHSSQYYANPLYLNPANAGLFQGDYRVSAIYRNQWRNIADVFSTVAFSGDFNTNKNVNIGINILNQTAGDAGYKYTNGYLSIAYTGVKFGRKLDQHISIGLQAGFINRKIDPSKFKLGDQWNPITGYSSANITNDVFATNSASTFDAGAGLLYYDGGEGKKANLYAGFSAFHISKPNDPFLESTQDRTIPVRYVGHAGVALKVSDIATVVPNVVYMRQGNAEEKMVGAFLRLNASADVDVLVGTNYRFNDAITPFAGLTYNDFTLGLSYDGNTSNLGKLVNNANNFELTISYIHKKPGKSYTDFLRMPGF